MYWCDCPIGSGRLMQELSCRKMLGFDKSPAFLEFNRKKGISVYQGDLFSIPFENEFDLVTSLHTIFVFEDFRDILKGYIKSLRKGGVLICDIVNSDYITAISNLGVEHYHNEGMTRSEVHTFFESLHCEVVESKLHSFYDNHFFMKWRKSKSRYYYHFMACLWGVLNKLYFRFRFFRKLLRLFEQKQPPHRFRKYLIAVKKL
ncbi:MAG: class I SAM-dependent methyltransferase [Deltaproteobacteria bacterium]|nr:class I SAM-dependent methyltransferase [Deltaproteobacteria bacterium]